MGQAARKLDDEELFSTTTYPRSSVHVKVDAQTEHTFWAGLSGDVEEGGVFIATHKFIPVGSLLLVHLDLPGETASIVALADVWWTRPFSRDVELPPGIGLKFIALDVAALAKIRRFAESVREPLFYDE